MQFQERCGVPGQKNFKILQSGYTKAQCVLMFSVSPHPTILKHGSGAEKVLGGGLLAGVESRVRLKCAGVSLVVRKVRKTPKTPVSAQGACLHDNMLPKVSVWDLFGHKNLLSFLGAYSISNCVIQMGHKPSE